MVMDSVTSGRDEIWIDNVVAGRQARRVEGNVAWRTKREEKMMLVHNAMHVK